MRTEMSVTITTREMMANPGWVAHRWEIVVSCNALPDLITTVGMASTEHTAGEQALSAAQLAVCQAFQLLREIDTLNRGRGA